MLVSQEHVKHLVDWVVVVLVDCLVVEILVLPSSIHLVGVAI